MKLKVIQAKIKRLREHALKESEAATKLKDVHGTVLATWWSAKWSTYNRVLNMLEEVDEL